MITRPGCRSSVYYKSYLSLGSELRSCDCYQLQLSFDSECRSFVDNQLILLT